MIVDATYVTEWDRGDNVFRTSCKFDTETKTATDIESADVDGIELFYCDREFIELADGTEIETFTNGDDDTEVVDGERQD